MSETHTISAPEETWEQVFTYAQQQNVTISDVTRQAWKNFFEETKNYRIIDIIIIFLLIGIFSITIIGVWIL